MLKSSVWSSDANILGLQIVPIHVMNGLMHVRLSVVGRLKLRNLQEDDCKQTITNVLTCIYIYTIITIKVYTSTLTRGGTGIWPGPGPRVLNHQIRTGPFQVLAYTKNGYKKINDFVLFWMVTVMWQYFIYDVCILKPKKNNKYILQQ